LSHWRPEDEPQGNQPWLDAGRSTDRALPVRRESVPTKNPLSVHSDLQQAALLRLRVIIDQGETGRSAHSEIIGNAHWKSSIISFLPRSDDPYILERMRRY
jgi:hypothetical protein